MHVFGLTGGIGSGKSTVANYWRRRGLPLIDADVLARAVVEPGSAALAEIVALFGAELLTASAGLDRKRLGARVFADREARAALEAITHPRIRELARQRFAALAQTGEPLAAYDVPLLFERGLEHELRPVVVVNAPDSVRLARTSARDGLALEQVQARLAAQLPLAEKVLRADFVIDNGTSLAAMQSSADQALNAVCRVLGVPAERYAAALSDPT